jgi:hypothetical protein
LRFWAFGGLLGTALVGILLKAGNILGEIENLTKKVQHQTGVTQARAESPNDHACSHNSGSRARGRGRSTTWLFAKMGREVEAPPITEIRFPEFEFCQQVLVVSLYDLPESLPVLPDHRLTLESDLQGLVWESEPLILILGGLAFNRSPFMVSWRSINLVGVGMSQ